LPAVGEFDRTWTGRIEHEVGKAAQRFGEVVVACSGRLLRCRQRPGEVLGIDEPAPVRRTQLPGGFLLVRPGNPAMPAAHDGPDGARVRIAVLRGDAGQCPSKGATQTAYLGRFIAIEVDDVHRRG